MIIQLSPPLPCVTPKGKGYALFLKDRGMEFEDEWVVGLDNGEIWSFRNSEIRLQENITFGRYTSDISKSISANNTVDQIQHQDLHFSDLEILQKRELKDQDNQDKDCSNKV